MKNKEALGRTALLLDSFYILLYLNKNKTKKGRNKVSISA